jgi:hypothetical protein
LKAVRASHFSEKSGGQPMKIFIVIAICILSAVSAFAQTQDRLDEKLSEMFKQNFSDGSGRCG